jgi:hypothetical protein
LSAIDTTQTGLMSRSATEIGRVLQTAVDEGVLLASYFPKLTFEAPLLLVDTRAGRIVIARSEDEEANQALLARPRCTFHCKMAGWHVEFIAAEPRAVTVKRRELIQCRFPELLASSQRREDQRILLNPPLRVVADAGGLMPFDGLILDVGRSGVGFLVYANSITLEPGTVLRGCRIEFPGGSGCVTDLEVRYSQPVTLPNGRRAMRSGCRILNACPELIEVIKRIAKK